MPRYTQGRHETGQNFLTDRRVINTIIREVAHTRGSLFEIGGGSGNLSVALEKLGRPLTVIEIDPKRVTELRARLAPATTVLTGDFLKYRLGAEAKNIVGNLPFHETTAMLRRLLHATTWRSAVLLAQWEVARRRAGVGGVSMMSAQWFPWYEFALIQRVPRHAFSPIPSVDGGLFTITRRTDEHLARSERAAYQHWVNRLFTVRGASLDAMLANSTPFNRGTARRWMLRNSLPAGALPKDIPPHLWAELYRATQK